MSASSGNAEQAEFWDGQAPFWIEFEDEHERVGSVFNEPLFEAVSIQPGDSVLDVGCGTGPTTMVAAGITGPDGQVVGVDLTEALLARGRELAADKGVANVVFRRADVQVDEIADQTFDAAISRFGVMFFSDPIAAFANIRKALKPSGRLAFVCWKSVFENEWMLVRAAAVTSATGQRPQTPGEGQPGPFSLEDDKRTVSILEHAGFIDARATALQAIVHIPETEIERHTEFATHTAPIREALKEFTDESIRRQIIEAFRQSLRDRLRDRNVSLSAAAWLVTARKPPEPVG